MDIDVDKAMEYRQRAEQLRVIADSIMNPESRETMLKLAENYERLADSLGGMIGVLPPEFKSRISN
jgi:hypothetical protein